MLHRMHKRQASSLSEVKFFETVDSVCLEAKSLKEKEELHCKGGELIMLYLLSGKSGQIDQEDDL